jgi:DNA mismatch endonuclease (patch repair protein)
MDTLTPQERSALMAKIRSTDTAPELLVRRSLWRLGLRYRLQNKLVPGTPDLWFPRRRVALFVHGCFWHGHEDCPLFRPPKSRTAFWKEKIRRNRLRDNKNLLRLLAEGFSVATVWECALRKDPTQTIELLENFLRNEMPPASRFEVWAQGNELQHFAETGLFPASPLPSSLI